MARSVHPKVLIAYGTALRDSRRAAGLSQEKLSGEATEAGLTPGRTHVSALEGGRKEPGLEVQFKLARVIGVRSDNTWKELAGTTIADRRLYDKRVTQASGLLPVCDPSPAGSLPHVFV